MKSSPLNPANLLGQNAPAEQFEALTFVLKGITYVPHYRNRKIFVGPGYGRHNLNRYTQEQLLVKGAKPVTQMLWHRGGEGIVDKDHP
jgi:hypothetical protein